MTTIRFDKVNPLDAKNIGRSTIKNRIRGKDEVTNGTGFIMVGPLFIECGVPRGPV